MPYVLGIDVGTGYTSAAICPLGGPEDSEVNVVRLGVRANSAPSVLYLSEDGSLVVGDAAERRAFVDHTRVVRGFRRRVGDDVPLVVGGRPHLAHALTAAMTRWVVARVATAEGGPAEQVVVTHPASWGPYRSGLLHHALRRLGVRDVTLLPEPVAAAERHASRDRVDVGSALAVYRLGSGTFESSVVRRTSAGTFELLGYAETTEHLGGEHFEDALLDNVRAKLGSAFDELDPAHPHAWPAMSGLRRGCTEAKEKLSVVAEASIPVQLPHVRTQVRLTRAELEEMIRPALETTVEALLRTLRSSPVPASQLGAVLLIGGSSRIPLVTELVSAELACPIAVEADPELTIAKGAALAARRIVDGSAGGLAELSPAAHFSIFEADGEDGSEHGPGAELALAHVEDDLAQPPPRPPVEIAPLDVPGGPSAMRFVRGVKPSFLGVAALLVIVVGVLTFIMYTRTSAHPAPATRQSAVPPESVAATTAPAPALAPTPTRPSTSIDRSTEPSTKGRR